MVVERLRNFVADDVAQDASEHGRNHSHQHGDDGWHAGGDGELRSSSGKQTEPDGIGPLHRAFGRREMSCLHEEHRQDR